MRRESEASVEVTVRWMWKWTKMKMRQQTGPLYILLNHIKNHTCSICVVHFHSTRVRQLVWYYTTHVWNSRDLSRSIGCHRKKDHFNFDCRHRYIIYTELMMKIWLDGLLPIPIKLNLISFQDSISNLTLIIVSWVYHGKFIICRRTVQAQLGQKPSISRGTVGAQPGKKHCRGIIGAQSGHSLSEPCHYRGVL
jgi:hypothetical protein